MAQTQSIRETPAEILGLPPVVPKEDLFNAERLKCKRQGGTWDAENDKCILPQTISGGVEDPNAVETFSSQDGRASGITVNGKTYLGLSPSDVDSIAAGEADRRSRPSNTQAVGTAKKEIESKLAMQQALSEIGLTEEEIAKIENTPLAEAGIDWQQALSAGAAATAIPAATGAATGALAGLAGGPLAPVTVPIGTAVLGSVGAISGFVSGMKANIKSQQAGEIGAAKTVLTNAKTNMQKASLLATDPTQVTFAQESYDFWEAEAYKARTQLKAETSGNLNNWMDDGRKDLADFDLFLKGDFSLASTYKQRIIKAANQQLTPEERIQMMSEDLQ